MSVSYSVSFILLLDSLSLSLSLSLLFPVSFSFFFVEGRRVLVLNTILVSDCGDEQGQEISFFLSFCSFSFFYGGGSTCIKHDLGIGFVGNKQGQEILL